MMVIRRWWNRTGQIVDMKKQLFQFQKVTNFLRNKTCQMIRVKLQNCEICKVNNPIANCSVYFIQGVEFVYVHCRFNDWTGLTYLLLRQ